MAAGSVPTTNLNAFYTNTTSGTTADPAKIDAAIADIVQTINDNRADDVSTLSTHKSAVTLDHPDASVTEAKLAANSVTTAKITDANVTTAKLADLSVTTAKLADGSITSAKIADMGIATGDLADSSVTAAKVADGTLTAAKFVAGALTNDTQNGLRITALEADKVNKTESVTKSVMPMKPGVATSKPKLVIVGSTNDQIKVAQYNGSKYVFYTFQAATGDSSSASVGGNWALIRIRKAALASMVYVAKKTYASTVGNVTTLFAPSLRNTLEDNLVYNMGNEDTASFDSSTGDGYGLGMYGIDNTGSTSSVTWSMNVGSTRKANVLVYGSSGSSASADILVNGEVVKSFDPTKLNFSAVNHYAVIEFEIPQSSSTATSVDVTLRNNDTAGKKLYFSCCNFMWLKDYDGRDIDFYKVFATTSSWLDSGGASDYAIFDTDLQKWCGSYHGGETRETAKITWTSGASWRPVNQWHEGRYLLKDKSTISVGWIVLPSFKIMQVTNINSKGKMLSIYNFDIDGTVEMDFSFYDGTINVNNFFTALTATHVDFGYVKYPRYETLPAGTTPLYFSANDGHIQQYNQTANLTLGIRFTRFLSDYQATSKKNGWIYNDATYYKKFYYGYADEYSGSVLVSNLQFKKALDFLYE